MRRGRISAEFAAGVSKEEIMAASGEAAPAELTRVAELRS
jgi:hypothetical protein